MISLTLGDISNKLTKEVIEEAFRLKTNTKDTIKSIEVSRATAPGEGLLSVVFRIKVTGSQKTTSFIVKGLVGDKNLQNALNCKKYFKREMDFFSRVVPVLVDLQPSLGAKERLSRNLPNCYGSLYDGDNAYIILEDLSESNCQSVSETPSKEEKINVLRGLAHFHAVSMALRIAKPEEFNKLAESLPEMYYTEKNRDWYSKYLHNAVEADRQVIVEMEDADSIYFKKFHEILNEDMYGEFISAISTRGEHAVLCHGDSWAPNFLYSKNRMVIIDFQLVRLASPATDLAYWLMLCTNKHTTNQEFLDAVDAYYSAVEYFLTDMGFDASQVFPRSALDQELKLYGKYGFLGCLTSFPLMCADKLDYSLPLEQIFPGVEKVPLEQMWSIKPIEDEDQKLRLRNALRVAVDVGLL